MRSRTSLATPFPARTVDLGRSVYFTLDRALVFGAFLASAAAFAALANIGEAARTVAQIIPGSRASAKTRSA